MRSVFQYGNLGDSRQLDADGKNTWVVFSDLTSGVETELGLGVGETLDARAATTLNRTLQINDHAGDRIVDRDLENALVVRVGLSFRPRMSGTPTGNGRIMGHLSWQYIWFDDLTGNGTGRVPMSPRLPLA